MNRYWVVALLGVTVMWGGVGCVSLDEHQALKRAHATLEEQKAALQDELLACESALSQKDTQISSLQNELSAKNQLIANLEKERDKLKADFDDAFAKLQEMAGKTQEVTIIDRPLPAKVDQGLTNLAEKYGDLLEYDPK